MTVRLFSAPLRSAPASTCLNDARIIRIPDTLHVTDIMVSENMLPEILQRNDMQVLGEPEEWPFDENGNLW